MFIITTVPITLKFFKNQIKELNHHFDVTLISSKGNELEEIGDSEGVKTKTIKMERDINALHDIFSLISVFFYLLKNRPQIIHCNTPKAALLSLIVGYLLRIKHRIYYIHGLRYEGASGRKRKLLLFLEKLSCFCSTNIIAVSKGVKSKVEKELTNKEVNIIANGSPNGINIEEFINSSYDICTIKRELEIQSDDFVIGFVGRLVGDKGINELVSAFKQICKSKELKISTKLLLVGCFESEIDPLLPETLEEIKANKNIIYVGFQKDVKKYLSIMDVFVSPSYREGFGLTLLEANAMRVPVIVSNILGYSEIIEEGVNGFLISKKDVNQLKRKILEVIKSEEQLKEMKTKCVSVVKQKYEHIFVCKEAIKFYRKRFIDNGK